MSIKWSEDYSIGVKEIDNQHKELIMRFDAFLESCKMAKGKEDAVKMLKFLEDYVVYHFDAEESIQRKVNFPGHSAHKREHQKYIADIKQFKKRVDEEGANLSIVISLSQNVLDWLIKHISVYDKALGLYIKEQNKADLLI